MSCVNKLLSQNQTNFEYCDIHVQRPTIIVCLHYDQNIPFAREKIAGEQRSRIVIPDISWNGSVGIFD